MAVVLGCAGCRSRQRPPRVTAQADDAGRANVSRHDAARASGSTRSARDGGVLTCAPAPDALIDIHCVAPSIVLDIRYATDDNFTGEALYPVARCLLRRRVAEALAGVQADLEKRGLGLMLWDCYRPFSAQERLWARVPDRRYVARPVRNNGRPVSGSKHSRGAAVDATLVSAAGQPLTMPTGYDDFTPRAHRDAEVGPIAEKNRERLERAMVGHGFAPIATEWWHFDAPGWRSYPLVDEPLVRPSRSQP